MVDPRHQSRHLDDEDVHELRRGVPLMLPTVFPGRVSWPSVFGRRAPLELEIGFGRPHFLLERAAEAPDVDVVGIEWKMRWVRAARGRAQREGLENVRPLCGNAWLLTGALFAPGSLSAAYIHFPDPWWKAKHQKRRVVNDAFASVLASRMAPGGTVLVQTDVASLLEQILEVLEDDPRLVNVAGPGRLSKKPPTRARSHREKKCVADGVPVFRGVLARAVD